MRTGEYCAVEPYFPAIAYSLSCLNLRWVRAGPTLSTAHGIAPSTDCYNHWHMDHHERSGSSADADHVTLGVRGRRKPSRRATVFAVLFGLVGVSAVTVVGLQPLSAETSGGVATQLGSGIVQIDPGGPGTAALTEVTNAAGVSGATAALPSSHDLSSQLAQVVSSLSALTEIVAILIQRGDSGNTGGISHQLHTRQTDAIYDSMGRSIAFLSQKTTSSFDAFGEAVSTKLLTVNGDASVDGTLAAQAIGVGTTTPASPFVVSQLPGIGAAALYVLNPTRGTSALFEARNNANGILNTAGVKVINNAANNGRASGIYLGLQTFPTRSFSLPFSLIQQPGLGTLSLELAHQLDNSPRDFE